MKYKMLISDFDDTLADDNLIISDDNLKSIEKFQKAGGIFAINTGRMINSILPIAREYGLKGYIGCYQGGMIADIESGKILLDNRLTVEDTITQLEELESRGLHTHLYDNEKLYVDIWSDTLLEYERLAKIKASAVNMKLTDYARSNKINSSKIMAIDDNAVLVGVMNELMAKYPDIEYVLSKPIFLEIMAKTVNKGYSSLELAKLSNIDISEVVGVGDSLNDMKMIEVCGLGVAVSNAHLELKRSAKLVLNSSNNQSAISELIEKYILI